MSDCILRSELIHAIEDTDCYHINQKGKLVHGANSEDDVPLYKAEDIFNVINSLQSVRMEYSCDGCIYDGKTQPLPYLVSLMPCNRCIRREKDFYERLNQQTGGD